MEFRKDFPVALGCGERRKKYSGKDMGPVRYKHRYFGLSGVGFRRQVDDKPKDPQGLGCHQVVSIFLGPGIWDKETCEI